MPCKSTCMGLQKDPTCGHQHTLCRNVIVGLDSGSANMAETILGMVLRPGRTPVKLALYQMPSRSQQLDWKKKTSQSPTVKACTISQQEPQFPIVPSSKHNFKLVHSMKGSAKTEIYTGCTQVLKLPMPWLSAWKPISCVKG